MGFGFNIREEVKTVFNRTFWMCLIALIALTMTSGLASTDQSYAHGNSHTNQDQKTTKNSEAFITEAHFYGVPTFNITTDENGDSSQSDNEHEVLRRQFWGISIQ